MAHIVSIGVTCLGVVIGWLVRYFIRRFKTFGPGALSSVVSILLGGTVAKFLTVDKTTIWFYPVGLLVGFVAYQVIGMILLRGSSLAATSLRNGLMYIPPERYMFWRWWK
jgi:hypothetical protein